MVQTNSPDLWADDLPLPARDGHKYDRGHAVIFAATHLTGATRLAAEACSRMGAGLVSVLASERADIYRMALPPDIMVSEGAVADMRNPSAVIAGPGGLAAVQRDEFYNFSDCARVFDADAIPGLGEREILNEHCVLTPHEGEFARAFPDLDGERAERAAEAAHLTGAVIVLKGAETIIASPDGHLVVNEHASAWLAKAGTGDVLAGQIGGLAAQQMPVFEAACASVWIHGEAGLRTGPGLVAGDLAGQLPAIMSDLLGT